MTEQDRDELARVIPLASHRSDAGTNPPDRAEPEAIDPVRALEVLERRVGSGWAALPDAAGRPALRLEALLASGPTAVMPGMAAEHALSRASRLAASARVTLGLLRGQVALLGEALGVDLSDLPLDHIQRVAAATAALGTVRRPVSTWGSVPGAEAAAVVLEVAAPALRDAAAAHDELYTCFTERVWEIPVAWVVAGSRRWRPFARRRLGRELRKVSRTAALPGGLDRSIRVVLDAYESREGLAPLRPLLAHHLGGLDRGPLTDVDGALASLTAVSDLQDSLGARCDHARLERLLLADAFRSPEVARPALLVCRSIVEWSGDVAMAGGTDAPLGLRIDDLSAWVDEVQRDLPLVRRGWTTYRPLRHADAPLRELVDSLVLREHIAQAAAEATRVAEGLTNPRGRRWSAS